jgi:hypothetical protein
VESEGLLEFDSALDFTLKVRPDVKFDDGEGDIYGNVAILVSDMQLELQGASSSLSREARKTLESMLESLKPTMEDYEEIAGEHRKLGKRVPKEIREGLNDYNELKALSGDLDGINYLIGKGFSTDETFLNTLATVQGAGASVNESIAAGLLDNLEIITDAANETVTFLADGVEVGTYGITPELVENMEDLGVNLGDGLLNGAESEMAANKKSWLDWAIWPWNWFKKENEIHSPSKLFERGGKYIVQGLLNGLSVTALRKRISEMWDGAKTWWNDKKGALSTYTPNIGSIKSKLSSAWSAAKTWWTKSKSALSSYTPSIGSIRDKLSSAWSSAKTWWNNKKGNFNTYTPKIGSIKSVLENAWKSARTWWNKNVRLSIPSLSFKVTYSTANLGAVKKAIVNALNLPGWPKLSFAANGGIFDAGSLIWAGERGPEVVANAAGGKTGVMNVEQMSDAVYEGVYAAVVAAMRSNSGNGAQSVNVYLDGKQITSTVEQRQRERGATIMGSQVYSY